VRRRSVGCGAGECNLKCAYGYLWLRNGATPPSCARRWDFLNEVPFMLGRAWRSEFNGTASKDWAEGKGRARFGQGRRKETAKPVIGQGREQFEKTNPAPRTRSLLRRQWSFSDLLSAAAFKYAGLPKKLRQATRGTGRRGQSGLKRLHCLALKWKR